MSSDNMRVLFTDEEIQNKVKELAKIIKEQYTPENVNDPEFQKPIALCVLKGALFFFADLMREVELDFEIDFIRLSSYGSSSVSSGQVIFVTDTKLPLTGRDVLIVEDIVDSGNTMDFLREEFARRGARSIKICTLIDKRERRTQEVKIDYSGFTLAQGFIVGYGMDYAENYRALPAIYEILI